MDSQTIALSARQAECLWWAALGKTAKETGFILGVTERTVNFHLYSAFERLNVHSKNAAVAKAVRFNLLSEAPASASPTAVDMAMALPTAPEASR